MSPEQQLYYPSTLTTLTLLASGVAAIVAFMLLWSAKKTVNVKVTRRRGEIKVKKCKFTTQRMRYTKVFAALLLMAWPMYFVVHDSVAISYGTDAARGATPFIGWVLTACAYAVPAVATLVLVAFVWVRTTPSLFRGRNFFVPRGTDAACYVPIGIERQRRVRVQGDLRRHIH